MAPPVALDQELELRIDSLAYGGNGVARLDGFVLFVRRGLPGDLVREALGETNGAAAALVYVPHTTAGVTINERIDPELVDDDWEWKHVEDPDGPNAPSHARASLASSPQVLIPLQGGSLGLGTYQGIFFCEFDGPRDRKIYVTSLR